MMFSNDNSQEQGLKRVVSFNDEAAADALDPGASKQERQKASGHTGTQGQPTPYKHLGEHSAQKADDINQFFKEFDIDKKVQQEPKSSLLKDNRSCLNTNNVQLNKRHERNNSFLNHEKSQDHSEIINSMKSESGTSSERSSGVMNRDAIRLTRMKSIITSKVSIAGKKLTRQT